MARALQGIGSSCSSVSGMGMLADRYTDDKVSVSFRQPKYIAIATLMFVWFKHIFSILGAW